MVIILVVAVIGAGIYGIPRIYFHMKYSNIVESPQTTAEINGAFIQYSGLGMWNYSMWEMEFQEYQKLHFDTLILQFSFFPEENTSLYRSEYFDFYSGAVSDQLLIPATDNKFDFPNETDVISTLLTLGHKYNVSVWIGLASQWFDFADISDQIASEHYVSTTITATTEILQRFGNISSFAGLYLPLEVYSASWIKPNQGSDMGRFYSNMTQAIHQIRSDCRISCAPFFAPDIWEPNCVQFWENFLSIAGIDVLIMQDGVGCHRVDLYRDIPWFYGWLYSFCLENKIIFWTDLEVFNQTSKGSEIFQAEPTAINILINQLEVESRFVSKIIIFDSPHYFSMQYSNQSRQLVSNYEDYLQTN